MTIIKRLFRNYVDKAVEDEHKYFIDCIDKIQFKLLYDRYKGTEKFHPCSCACPHSKRKYNKPYVRQGEEEPCWLSQYEDELKEYNKKPKTPDMVRKPSDTEQCGYKGIDCMGYCDVFGKEVFLNGGSYCLFKELTDEDIEKLLEK